MDTKPKDQGQVNKPISSPAPAVSGEVKIVQPASKEPVPLAGGEKAKKKFNNPMNKWFKGLTSFVTKIDNRVAQVGAFKGMPVMGRRILILVVLGFAIFIIVIIFFGIIYRLLNPVQVVVRNPVPSPVGKVTPPPAEARNPSKYAEDEKVKELEVRVIELDKTLSETDVTDTTLTPPSLNFDVEFK